MRYWTLFLLGWGCTVAPAVVAAPVDDALGPILAVGPNGAGQAEAAAAWRRLAAVDADQMPAILAALDRARPLAANWLCTALDAVAQRAALHQQPLPAAGLEVFVCDATHTARARRLAYEWLLRADATAEERLLPKMLDDPSLELRRDAVARLSDEATALEKAGKPDDARRTLQRAFTAARDLDQVRSLAAKLKKLDAAPDMAAHFGFVTHWHVIGPFDNTGGQGFDRPFPPEKAFDPQAEYDGKHGKVRWIDHVTKHELGQVDLNAALVEEKDVAGYAAAEFVATRAADVQFRVATINALKVWLNGRQIAAHRVYHGGTQFDQYVAPATLREGKNLILVKVCQNDQTQDWAKPWVFQLRVCDSVGTAVRPASSPEN